MQNRFTELRRKEVVNICNGNRLGFVQDVLVELPCGQIAALIVPGACHIWEARHDHIIPWSCIRQIGPELILIEADPAQIRAPRERKGWF